MKTDAEVLKGAIEILEREDGWCQGAYFVKSGTKLSFCAEGAIRTAAELWHNLVIGSEDRPYYSLNKVGGGRFKQCDRINDLVAAQFEFSEEVWAPLDMKPMLRNLNDHPTTTAADIILAMKKALAEVQS